MNTPVLPLSVVVIDDPVAQMSGIALVRRAVTRTGTLYLVPEWDVVAVHIIV